MLGIDGLYRTARNGKDGAECRQADPVHRIDRNAQIAFPDRIQIDQGDDVVQIFVHGVHLHHLAALHQFLVSVRRHLPVFLRIRDIKLICLF